MRAPLAVLVAVLAAPFASADTDLCRPFDAEFASVTCETTAYPNNEVHRSTEVEVELWHDAPFVPTFVLRVRFEEQDAGNASAPRCSIYYHELDDGLGPQSIEWGTSLCPYLFYVEDP